MYPRRQLCNALFLDVRPVAYVRYFSHLYVRAQTIISLAQSRHDLRIKVENFWCDKNNLRPSSDRHYFSLLQFLSPPYTPFKSQNETSVVKTEKCASRGNFIDDSLINVMWLARCRETLGAVKERVCGTAFLTGEMEQGSSVLTLHLFAGGDCGWLDRIQAVEEVRGARYWIYKVSRLACARMTW